MRAEVRTIRGIPELTLDGKVESRVWSRPDLPGYRAVDKLRQYLEAGIKVHFVSMHQPDLLCWDGADYYSTELYRAHVKWIVQAQPDARLILGRRGSETWTGQHRRSGLLHLQGGLLFF